jgi:hypothetical protein
MAEENEQEGAGSMDRIGIPLDVLDNIIADLNSNEELKMMFGDPVSGGLIIVAERTEEGDVDLRIEDAGVAQITPEQTSLFLEILDSIIKTNAV